MVQRSNDSLAKLLKNAIKNSTGPKMGRDAALAVGLGRDINIPRDTPNSDPMTQVEWNYYTIVPVGYPRYITPTTSSFKQLVAESGVSLHRNNYISQNGNIKQRFKGTSFGPHWANYNCAIFTEYDRGINLTVNTAHSFYCGIDSGDGVIKIIAGSNEFGPNRYNSISFGIASGIWYDFNVAFYASGGGTYSYELGGDLALQVSKIAKPDAIAPVAPVAPNVTLEYINPQTPTYKTKLTWVSKVIYEPDRLSYEIYSASGFGGAPAASEYKFLAGVPVNYSGEAYGYQYIDNSAPINLSGWYKLKLTDRYLNESDFGPVAGLLIKDVTIPSNITAATINGTLNHNPSTWLLVSSFKTANITWTEPTDVDLKWINIYKQGWPDTATTNMPAGAAWGTASRAKLATIPAGVSSYKFTDPDVTGGTNHRYWFWLQTQDSAGNTPVGEPTRTSAQFQEYYAPSYAARINISPAQNSKGWNNTNVGISVQILADVGGGAQIYWKYSYEPLNGTGWTQNPVASLHTLTAETGPTGYIYSAYGTMSDGSVTDAASRLIKIDKTPLGTVTGLSIQSIAEQTCDLNWWNPVANSATDAPLDSLFIYTGSIATNCRVGSVSASVSSLRVSNLTPKRQYGFFVTTVDQADNENTTSSGANYNAVTGTTIGYAPQPSLINNGSFEYWKNLQEVVGAGLNKQNVAHWTRQIDSDNIIVTTGGGSYPVPIHGAYALMFSGCSNFGHNIYTNSPITDSTVDGRSAITLSFYGWCGSNTVAISSWLYLKNADGSTLDSVVTSHTPDTYESWEEFAVTLPLAVGSRIGWVQFAATGNTYVDVHDAVFIDSVKLEYSNSPVGTDKNWSTRYMSNTEVAGEEITEGRIQDTNYSQDYAGFSIDLDTGVLTANEFGGKLEQLRKDVGPYYISQLVAVAAPYIPTVSSYCLQLDEDPYTLGGIEKNNETPSGNRVLVGDWETTRRFKVEHYDTTTSGYYVWKDLQFARHTIEGASKWWTRLDNANLYGKTGEPYALTLATGLDYTTLNTTGMICKKDWDSLPIWNGHRNCITFSTDDGNYENYGTWMPIFESMGMKYTINVNYGVLGNTGKLTTAQVIELSDSGYEIGNHTINHSGVNAYKMKYNEYWDSVNNITGTIFDVRSTTLTGTDNYLVNLWTDSAGNQNLTQGTADRKPVCKFNYYNGFAGIYCSGSTTAEGLGATISEALGYSGDNHFFVVYSPDKQNMGNTAIASFNSNETRFLHSKTDTNYWLYVSGATYYNLGPNVSGIQMLTLSCVSTGTYLYRNGTLVGSNDAGGPMVSTGIVMIGSLYGATLGLSGAFFETKLVKGSLTRSEIQLIEGSIAHRWNLNTSLIHNHPWKSQPPQQSIDPQSQMYTEIYGNKTELEQLINFNGGSWRNKNYTCKTFAYPGSAPNLVDEYAMAAVMVGHIGSRMQGVSTAAVISGDRDNAHFQTLKWGFIYPYFVGIQTPISVLITGAGQPTGETYTNMWSNLDSIAYTQGQNAWGNFYWHTSGANFVSSGNMRAILDATAQHSGDFWVAPFGTVLEYWRRAHPNVSETEWRRWL